MPDSAVIALDAMGGDFGPEVVVPAAAKVLSGNSALRIILVGDEEQLRACAENHRIQLDDRLTIQHASEVVEMHDEPALAMRKKKDSSMRVAINQVHDGAADAVVSAGNTGALMATAKFVLKTLPGIDRPADKSQTGRLRDLPIFPVGLTGDIVQQDGAVGKSDRPFDTEYLPGQIF